MATFRQIELFLILAEELHFGRAAERAKISQAALSKDINALEKSVNCRLFDRSDKRNIYLTEAGKAYREQIKGLPQQLQKASASAQQAERGEIGTLVIAVANIVYAYLSLGDLLFEMHEKYPTVKLNIRDCQGSPMVLEQLHSHKADIGFFAVNDSDLPRPDIAQKKLLSLPIHLAIPAGHYLARKKSLEISDLEHCNFILPPREMAPWLRKHFDDFYLAHFHKYPQAELEALGIHATRQLVAAGLGIGVVIKPPGFAEQGNIVYRPAPLDTKRVILAGWEADNQSRILKNLLKLIPAAIK